MVPGMEWSVMARLRYEMWPVMEGEKLISMAPLADTVLMITFLALRRTYPHPDQAYLWLAKDRRWRLR